MTKAREVDTVISTMNIRRIYLAIELSQSAWVIAIQSPAVDKVSLFRIAGGDIEKLFLLLEQARRRLAGTVEVCACYEASYDGFWIHRVLTARGVACTVLDSASIQVSRRRPIRDRSDRCGRSGSSVDGDLPRRTPGRQDCSCPFTGRRGRQAPTEKPWQSVA